MGWDLPAGVEDGLVVGDEDVDAVDVAAAGGDALGQLRHDAHRVLAAGRRRRNSFTSAHGINGRIWGKERGRTGHWKRWMPRRFPAGTAAERGRRAKESMASSRAGVTEAVGGADGAKSSPSVPIF